MDKVSTKWLVDTFEPFDTSLKSLKWSICVVYMYWIRYLKDTTIIYMVKCLIKKY